MNSPQAAQLDLQTRLAGRVVVPGEPDYDDYRAVMAGGVDPRPAMIARPRTDADVAEIISFARESGLPFAVRSGGHSAALHSTADGGLVLDLRDMTAVDIDPVRRTVWAEAGVTAGRLTHAVGGQGLAVGFGDESHPDLFWAIRGGGGNFGVVTRFQFRLRELPGVVGGMLLLPATPATVAGFVAAADAAPAALTTIANVMPCPPLPFVAPEHHGQLVIMGVLCFAGGTAAGSRALAPFHALGEPLADLLRPISYAEMFTPGSPDDHPVAVAKTMFVDSVDAELAAHLLDHLAASDASIRVVQLRVLGGAVTRVPANATAYAHRSSKILVNVAAFVDEPFQRAERLAWVEAMVRLLDSGDPGAYVNFVGDEGPDRVRAAYPGETWGRLAALKAAYDPTNFFCRNHNVPPAGAAEPR